MKRYLYPALAAMLAMMASSCQDLPSEEECPSTLGREFTFTASAEEQPATRSSRQQDGSVLWSAQESIFISCDGQASGRFTSTNTEPAAAASFSGSFSAEISDAEHKFWAVYPYSDDVLCDGESVTLTVPSQQIAKVGSFADGLFPSVAVGSGPMLSFRHVCGGARFSVSHSGIRSVTISGKKSEALAGRANVTMDAQGQPSVKSVSDAATAVTVTAPDGGTFEPGKEYYIVLLPVTFSDGFSLEYRREASAATFITVKSVTVNRARFGALLDLDANLSFDPLGGDTTFDPTQIVLSLGGISDTHVDGISTTPGKKFASALTQLKNLAAVDDPDGLDGIMVAGDLINDAYNNTARYDQVDYFKSIYESVLDPVKVPMVYAVGNHDVYGQWTSNSYSYAKNISNRLGADYFLTDLDNDARTQNECRHCRIGDYHILCVTPVSTGPVNFPAAVVNWLDAQLEAITKADPYRYVFVVTHPMIYNTVYGSTLDGENAMWGTTGLTAVLRKYPQAVTLGGHLHFPLNDPRSIWQGEFTALGCGSVRYMAIERGGYQNMAGATTMSDKDEFSQGLLLQLDVHGNLRVCRMDFYHNEVIENALTVSHPVADLAHLGKYAHNVRSAANKAPVLTSLVAEKEDIAAGVSAYTAKWDAGQDDEFVHHYVLTLKKGNTVVWTRKYLADFYRSAKISGMKKIWESYIGTPEAGDYTLTLTSYDSWDAQSNTLTTSFSVSAPGTVAPAVYVDLDFADGAVTDACGNVDVVHKGGTFAKTAVTHAGKSYTVDAIHVSGTDYVQCMFNKIGSFEKMQAFGSAGFCVEAFYVEKSLDTKVHGIVCGTQYGGWGLAQRANGVPYFIVAKAYNSYTNADAKSAASTTDLTHVMGVFDVASRHIRIYVNGVLNADNSYTGAFYPGSGNTFNQFCLGADVSLSAVPDYPSLDVVIADVKFHSGVMDASAVSAAYQAAVAALGK